MYTPISIGEDECTVFERLVSTFRPANCLIVGNAFGFSSAFIAQVMMACDGKSVVSIDDQSEGEGQRCAAVARALAERLGLSILKNKKGRSPEDTARSVEAPVHELIFLDGCHHSPAVVQDFDGILPFADEKSIVVWHDYWLAGVQEGVQDAAARGWKCLWLPTSCEMVVATRDAAVFERLRATFADGRESFQRVGVATGARVVVPTLARFWLERLRIARAVSG